MIRVILFSVFFLSLNSYASLAKVNLSFSLQQISNSTERLVLPEGSQHFDCSFYQTIDWSNMSNSWTCRTTKLAPKTQVNIPVTIGYDYDRQTTFSQYSFNSPKGLGRLIFSFIDPSIVVSSGGVIKLFYRKSEVVAADKSVLINTNQGSFLLTLESANYIDSAAIR